MRENETKLGIGDVWAVAICGVTSIGAVIMDMGAVAFVMLVITVFGMLGLAFPAATRRKLTTRISNEGIRRIRPDGTIHESVRWSDLNRISIMTTDDGPFAEDMFFMFYGEEGGVAVPNGDACELKLLDIIGELPGFDFMAVVVASGSVDWAEFECWSGESGDALAPILKRLEDPEIEEHLLTLSFAG